MSTPAAPIEGLTSRPAAESGTTLTGTITGLQGGETIVHRWRANGTAITGADGPSFTPEIGVNVADLDTLTYNPTVDGTEIASAAGTVRFAPPVFTVQPTLGASSFTAGDIVTLTAGVAPQADLSISTLTLGGVDKSGEVSLLTWDTGGEAAGPIAYQVTAWNSGGATLSDVVVATLSAADTTAPVVTNAAVNTVPDPDELTFNVDEDGSLYYLINQSSTALAGAAIEAGGGDLSGGPFSVVSGAVTQNIDLSSLTASTTYQMHFTVKDAAGNYSTDTVVEFTTEAAAVQAVSLVTNDIGLITSANSTTISVAVPSEAGVVVVFASNFSNQSWETATLDAAPMTRRSFISAAGRSSAAFTIDVSANTGTVDLVLTMPVSVNVNNRAYAVYHKPGGAYSAVDSEEQVFGAQLNLDINVSADDDVVAWAYGRDDQFTIGDPVGSTWTGATKLAEGVNTEHGYATASATGVVAATPRQVRADGAQNPTAQRWAGIIVRLGAAP